MDPTCCDGRSATLKDAPGSSRQQTKHSSVWAPKTGASVVPLAILKGRLYCVEGSVVALFHCAANDKVNASDTAKEGGNGERV